MFSGPPLPLPTDFPMWQLLLLLQSQVGTGAWLRGSGRSLRLHIRSGRRCSEVLISGDLGLLLRCCAQVVVREGNKALLLESELLIQWRALQVVTAIPYLPGPHRLAELIPNLEIGDRGFHVPTRSCPPEAVLAECLIHGIPVAETRIVYRPPSILPQSLAAPLARNSTS